MDKTQLEMGQRKCDHIDMAFNAKVSLADRDQRFIYEPLLAAHPDNDLVNIKCNFLGKSLDAPLWVSSMTGGTSQAAKINYRLANMCAKHKIGMGLGSIRPLLTDNNRFQDFNLRPILGDNIPFYANLGIAQLDQLLKAKTLNKLTDLLYNLNVDGLIIHINPLQEFLQPEGDRFLRPAIDTIEDYLSNSFGKTIVKEVGQGMGPKSLESLMNLSIDGIELAGLGGTNFSKLELMRGPEIVKEVMQGFVFVGHSAEEMIRHINYIRQAASLDSTQKGIEVIISGGIKSLLDGFFLLEKCHANSVIGMASQFLKYAIEGQDELDEFTKTTKKALSLSKMMLNLKESNH
jgi:isopentenyl-diphosphate Delta-isomerase